MRGISFLILFSFIAWAEQFGPGFACEHDPSTFRCVRFLHNYDADTVTIQIPNVHPLLGDKISVRVSGVDTPEIRGKCATEKKLAQDAKALVTALLTKARHINITNVGRDKYFRVLGDVEADGVSLSKLLLKKGLAYPYDGGKKQSWCGKRVTAGQ